ncbi:MAG: nitroreductase family protein [Clostridia bacterium]|nr:nitroreductase family protein [Clostridia bacterium]
MTELDSDKLLQAMKSRRSIRKFNDKPVEQEKIDKILEAGRYCPTAKNDQDVSYIILGSKQKEIEEHCMKLLNKGLNIAKKVSSTVRSLDIKDDFFFKNAPLVIVVVSKSKINGGLASSYMELMAESLGLGVLYSGFFQAFASASGKVKKLMNLPKGYKIISCLVIGYHDKKYLRIPPRKSLQSKEN